MSVIDFLNYQTNAIRIKSRSTTRNSEGQDRFTQNPRKSPPVGKLFSRYEEKLYKFDNNIFFMQNTEKVFPIVSALVPRLISWENRLMTIVELR